MLHFCYNVLTTFRPRLNFQGWFFMQYKYSNLTHQIIGCAMKVHNQIGGGFQESIYQKSLVLEFAAIGINFEYEKSVDVFYNHSIVGRKRVDFLIEGIIALELKAKSTIENSDIVQAINYLEAFSLEVGLLINFAPTKLQFRRVWKNYS